MKYGMFEWNVRFSLHVDEIDREHQELFRLAGELYAAMKIGQGKVKLARSLDRLVEYTRVHFRHEEKLMQSTGYPDSYSHKAEHDALTREVLRFQGDFVTGRAAVTAQVMQFLSGWLERHIGDSDAALAQHLTAAACLR